MGRDGRIRFGQRYPSLSVAALDDSPKLEIAPSENPVRVVWALAWPAVALNSLQVINTLLDRFFIGHLELPALTGHSASMNVMFLMFSLAMALATGATAIVSRAWGAGEIGEVKKASHQAMSLAITSGILMLALTALFSGAVAKGLLPSDDVAAQKQMMSFLAIYALGLPGISVIQVLAGALRGVGDTKSPMIISGAQILMHITLNFLLIYPSHQVFGFTIHGFNMGLAGAATALATSATVSAIIYIFYSGRTPLGQQWRLEIPIWSWVKRIMRIAVPAGFMAVLRVLSLTAFTLVLKIVPGGSVAIAAMGISFSIESIMFMPAFGLSAATSALVGQSLGMKKPDRAERLAWIAAHHGALVTLALCAPIFFGAPYIAKEIVGDKQAVIDQATILLRYLCATEIFFAYSMVMIGAMQGAGDTTRPFWITVVSLWGIRVPLSMILALKGGQLMTTMFGMPVTMPIGFGMAATGTWIAISTTQAVQGILSILAFKSGAWKNKSV
ncbi:MATE family efflux transporter [soil metagenome]